MRDNSPALPTFQQAGAFARLIGINSPEVWARYIEGKSRQDLFEQVISVINQRVIAIQLEA